MGAVPAIPTVCESPSLSATAGPLSAEQLEQLAAANLRARKALGAAKVAAFNGWSFAVMAVVSLPFAFSGPESLVVTAAMGIVAWNEFRGRRRVRAFDLRGPRLLGWNQLGLMAVMIGYAAWRIYSTTTSPPTYAEEMERDPQLRKMLGSFSDLQRMVTLAVYGGIAVGTVIFQGLTSAYYFTRGRHVRAYLRETPEWVVQLQRRMAG